MSYGLYQYTDNAGNVWSVSVPVDIATALGMTAATTQPYIDATIAARFANFRDPSGNVRQGVIPTQVQFGTIVGTVITIGGTNFRGTSAIGETIPASQPALIQPPMALMGPPGPPGPVGAGLTVTEQYLTSDVTITAGSSGQIAYTITAPAAGSYLITAMASLLNTSGSDALWQGTIQSRIAVYQAFAPISNVISGTEIPWIAQTRADLAVGEILQLILQDPGADITIRHAIGLSPTNNVSGFLIAQYA